MEGTTLTDRAAVKQALVGKDYIETIDWTVEELEEVLAVSMELKAERKAGKSHLLLPQKTLYMLFLDADKTQVSHGESPKDMGIILGRYGEGIAIRHDLAPYEGSAWMRQVAEWADVPLINLQCDIDHPTQTIADVMTLKEHRGDNLRGMKVAMTWAYAPSYARPLSVPQGVATLFPRFGMDVVIAHPPGFELMPEVIEKAQAAAAEAGSTITFMDDMDEAFRGADAVYPKSWGRLDAFSDESKALAESGAFADWICDARRMSLAAPDALYMHCLPADRGREVTDEVIDGPQSVVFDEAENRMHTGKALMALTMGGFA